MVATRSLTDSTNQNTGSVEATLERLSNSMEQMNQHIEGLLVFQQLSQPIINLLNNGEGTSNRGGQPAFGRLTKFEFPKFYGEDVQGWLYRYEEGIKERFDPVNEDPMVELKILKQVGSVQAYHDLFKVLLNKVGQPEAYAISLFIGGLKDEIGLVVRMFRPNKLTDAYSLAKMQEATLAIPKSKYTSLLVANKTAITPFVSKSRGYAAKSNTLALPAPPQTMGPNRHRKQYSPGHKCSGQMYCLEVAGCKEEIEDEDCVDSELDKVVVREEEVMPQVSLNAMNGVNSHQTIRIKGHVGKQVVHMLVDCGSIHNFLDLQAAKRMGCRMSKMCPLQVSVANGQVMSSVYMCKNFKWNLQGHDFVTNYDFKNLVMEFVVNGQKCVLWGTTQHVLKWMQGRHVSSSLSQMRTEISFMAMCIYPATLMQLSGGIIQSKPQIQTLLKEFATVFDDPRELPPKRSHDHTIPLTPNAPPVNIRPYRHPPIQKDAIELMVKELLEAGTIRNNQTPFSSPIVMVKKKDGTWRMCVDLGRPTMKSMEISL
ncbi:reverse transcriptase [Tanacetum coccineum]